jgi:assimilatory nitrate reductase catalytic subunit
MRSSLPADAVRTTCPYCGVGCGLVVSRRPDGSTAVLGDRSHPANLGRICAKGAALGETIGLEGRLLYPEISGQRVRWETALDRVADEFRTAVREYGPDSVAFYLSGQLLTEDYYVANKLMKGFLGSANVDTNSRLCMSSAVAGHKRAFGSDTVPGCYEDLELANLIVLVGSNLAWCHPVLYQRIAAAKERRPEMKVVVIDPRRTVTCTFADLHLALQPGTDAFLFAGLLVHLQDRGAVDRRFVAEHTSGTSAALSAARAAAGSIDEVASACGVPREDVATFFQWFTETERTVTAFSQGVNQSTSGTDKANAILNCHLATGRVGRPGMGPFSLTGQPNAMGGREVGGMANQLAAHMELANPEHRDRVQRFWGGGSLPAKPGLLAVDLFRALEAGRIKALWVMATNPAVSLPDADRVQRALAGCPFVAVSDCIRDTDTTRHADVLLPALGWGEKEGTVTNSERRISRQRAFLPVPGEARSDWWALAEVAKRLGFGAAFSYANAAEIFREHAALSAFENDGERDFDLGGLADLSDDAYSELAPVQWPVPKGTVEGTPRLFGEGRFYSRNGKASFVSVTPRMPKCQVDSESPLVLNTGRMRDQWHTMTRTGRSPRLTIHAPEPTCAVHPQDAAKYGILPGTLVRITSDLGGVVVRAIVDDGQRPGSVFVPIHWNDQNALTARVGALIPPNVDPVSGQPEFKHAAVRIEPCPVAWFGVVMARQPLDLPGLAHCTRIQGHGYWRYEIAGTETEQDWSGRFLHWVTVNPPPSGSWVECPGPAPSAYRAALLAAGQLSACLFVESAPSLPDRAWLAEFFDRSDLTRLELTQLLAGQPNQAEAPGGTMSSSVGVSMATLGNMFR